jgi:SHS2 domain-containing protein
MVPAPAAASYGTFPTTADMGIWAKGPTPASLLEGLALAFYDATTELTAIEPRERRELMEVGQDPVGLAVAFVGHLVTLFQTDGFLARTVRVELGGPRGLTLIATLEGEPFDPERHPPKVEVKAVTLHEASFDAEAGEARLVVDI